MVDFESYKRACIRVLAAHGIEPYPASETYRVSAADVLVWGLEEKDAGKARFTVWCAESLLYAFRQIELGDTVQAFRAYSQYREYVGRLHGYDPMALSDAGSACSRAISDALRPPSP